MSDTYAGPLFFVGMGVLALLAIRKWGPPLHIPDESEGGTSVIRRITADVVGITTIGVLLAIAAYFTPPPPEGLNRGLYIFIFAFLAVSGVYLWHREDPPKSSRQWAKELGIYVLAYAIIAGVGVGYAYAQGHRGSMWTLIESNGTFLILITLLPGLILIALGGVVRAVVVEKRHDG